jgi:hypothetical protein
MKRREFITTRFTNGMRPEANYCLSTTRDGPSI